jgi:hypothetical protein
LSITTEGWGSGGITTESWGYPPRTTDPLTFILRIQRTSDVELLFQRNAWLSLPVDFRLPFELEMEVSTMTITLRIQRTKSLTLRMK